MRTDGEKDEEVGESQAEVAQERLSVDERSSEQCASNSGLQPFKQSASYMFVLLQPCHPCNCNVRICFAFQGLGHAECSEHNR